MIFLKIVVVLHHHHIEIENFREKRFFAKASAPTKCPRNDFRARDDINLYGVCL